MAGKLNTTSKRQSPNRKLEAMSAKQRLFVAELLREPTLSPTEAARRAGYKAPQQTGQKLMENPVIMKSVSARLNNVEEECSIDRKLIVQYLYNALTQDPLDTFNCEGGALTLKDLDQIPKHIRQLINKIKVRTKYDKEGNPESYVELEWINKNIALEMCAKHVGLFQDKMTITHDVSNVISKLRDVIAGVDPVLTDEDLMPTIDGTVR